MKVHTSDFKDNIKLFGKEIDSKITYTLNNEEIVLDGESLNAITPHYEGNILKSVMKQLDIDSNVIIPIGTEINYQFGVLIDDDYEYIDFGNYIVYSVEKQEDTKSWKIVAYDKMLYSMKPYETLTITYPITIRNYTNAICEHLGLTFKNAEEVFANYDKEIENELYLNSDGNSLEYTFRDVLDEIAQATASTICINKNDELEIRYITETNDTIDEEYLKDINVNFGEKYGPVNSIVLSRGAESDNIYLRDEESIETNGLCELKISENQILKGNNRDEFLPDLLETLDGLEYYINDYSSTGIGYYDLCDRYTISIDNNTYSCIMLNDEFLVTQGVEENIHTDMPGESETDYTKADKTDRRINQTTLIVDKHEQEIQALTTKIVDISNTITGTGEIILENAHEGILHNLEIRGNISLLYPSTTLYPSSNLYIPNTYLKVDNELYKLDFDYLNYINETTYDKYVLKDDKQWIERNVGIDSGGNKYPLDETIIEEKPDLFITVKSNSHIQLLSFANAIIKIEYLLENNYTDNFATQAYVDSEIKITSDEINAEVSAKVNEDEIVAKLNLAIEDGQGIVQLKGNTVIIESDNFELDETGKINATGGDIAGFEINSNDGFQYKIYAPYDYNSADLLRIQQILSEIVTPTEQDLEKYDLNKNGQIDIVDFIRVQWFLKQGITTENYGMFAITLPREQRLNSATTGYLDASGDLVAGFNFTTLYGENLIIKYQGQEQITAYGESGNITCVSLTQTSLEENKKNFEKYEDSALEEIKKIDIYKYNLKNESDNDKKHIGFIIGDKYKYSKEITSQKNDGVDNYSFTSLLCKAIQEQQEQIEELQKEIKKLKEV